MQPPPVFFMPRASILLIVCPLLTGCGLLPPLGSKRMKKDVAGVHGIAPEKWSALPKIAPGAATGWLADFSSPALTQLVDRAITANPDLKR